MKRALDIAKRFLRPLLAFVGLIAFLGLWALAFQPEIPDEPPHFDPGKVAEAERLRKNAIDPANPVVVWQDVDYSEGPAAPWWPKGEAPVLAALVEKGLLPPVLERVGPEPVVLQGSEGIGRFGGSFVHAETASTQELVGVSHSYSGSSLVRWSPYGYPIVPHLARRFEVRDQFREYIFTLRKGVRWSDGHPLTTEDILYYWDHEVRDPAVNQTPSEVLIHLGKRPVFTAFDDHSLSIRFEDPYPAFLDKMAGERGQHLLRAPAHYRRRYHPTLGEPAFLEEAMARFRVPNRAMLYEHIKRWSNPEHPRLWPWIYRTYKANPPHVFVRNPYYYAVDPEGNQLPYIDQFVMREYTGDMADVAAVNGELSFRNIRFNQYSLFMSEREAGDYQLYHWEPLNRSNFIIYLNQTLRPLSIDPVVVQKREMIQRKEFRQALSLAIDRELINRIDFSGLLKPAQMAPTPFSAFYEEALASAFVEYDPARANQLLDGIGLEQRDRDGMRTLPDGSRLHLFFDTPHYEFRDLLQLVAGNWQAVGLRVTARYRHARIWYTELDALSLEIAAGYMNGKITPFVEPKNYVATQNSMWARGYGRWYSQGGLYGNPLATRKGGFEPPADSIYRKVMKIYDRANSAPSLEEQKSIIREVMQIAAENLWLVNSGITPPVPMMVKNGLRNLPPVAVWNGDFQPPSNCGIETFYWEAFSGQESDTRALERALTELTPMPGSDFVAGSIKAQGSGLVGRIVARLLWSAVGIGLLLMALRHPFIGRRLLIMVPTQGESFLGRKWLIGKKIKKELDKPEGISHAKMV